MNTLPLVRPVTAQEVLLAAPQALELPRPLVKRFCGLLKAAAAASRLWRGEVEDLTGAELATYLVQHGRSDSAGHVGLTKCCMHLAIASCLRP